jgi:N-methylhydantoinase A
MRVGVDTGGTFTDCVISEGSRFKILKVFSTPSSESIGNGVRELIGPIERLGTPLEIIHGTTIGTNTLIERRGARVALVTTAGFEDLIEIGRQNRPRLYDLNVQRDPPLVPRALRWGVGERTGAGGKILIRPQLSAVRGVARQVERSGVESIAVCFLFSFANPANERIVARLLRRLGLPVSVSHEILPEFREYERLSTVVTNAYLAPRISDYLGRLERYLGSSVQDGEAHQVRPSGQIASGTEPVVRPPVPRRELRSHTSNRIFVMQSNGGITTARTAAREPVRTILSGPAGGVVAAAWLAGRLGLPGAISFDMGGTSTDVSLFQGSPQTTRETTLGGLPVAVPVLDIHSVGAGGGSMARLDHGGALRVGPESAGAVPGPACYGRGGSQPAVADANLILGRLDPEHFLGGSFRLNVARAEEAFAQFLKSSRQLRRKRSSGLNTTVALAHGIVAVANATMERAVRVISVERGHDPRDFALICFGGAGGLHAADLARALGLRAVIVPQNPGAFSAIGVLLSDIIKDVSQSLLIKLRTSPNGSMSRTEFADLSRTLAVELRVLEQAARKELRSEHPGAARVGSWKTFRYVDVRYAGQTYEISVPFTSRFPQQFRLEHEKAFGYAHENRPLEIVNVRVRIVAPTPKPANFSAPRMTRRWHEGAARSGTRSALIKHKPVYWDNAFVATPFYDRERLPTGCSIKGPAVVVEYSSTTAVPPDYDCRVDEHLNLLLSRA